MDNKCRELFLDDIVKVFPIEAGVLTCSVPETVVKDTLAVSELGHSDGTSGSFANLAALTSWLSSRERLSDADESLLCYLLTEAPTVRVQEEQGISGVRYEITLSMNTMYFHSEEKSLFHRLEWNGHDFILEMQDGSYRLLRFFSPAQKFTHEYAGYGAKLTITMKNLTGIQEIVEN